MPSRLGTWKRSPAGVKYHDVRCNFFSAEDACQHSILYYVCLGNLGEKATENTLCAGKLRNLVPCRKLFAFGPGRCPHPRSRHRHKRSIDCGRNRCKNNQQRVRLVRTARTRDWTIQQSKRTLPCESFSEATGPGGSKCWHAGSKKPNQR